MTQDTQPIADRKEQTMQALALGTETRLQRAAIKRDLKTSTRNDAIRQITAIILDPPRWAMTWEIGRCLLCIPRFGKVKAQQACNAAHALPTRRIKDLSDRQRQTLAAHLTTNRITKGRP